MTNCAGNGYIHHKVLLKNLNIYCFLFYRQLKLPLFSPFLAKFPNNKAPKTSPQLENTGVTKLLTWARWRGSKTVVFFKFGILHFNVFSLNLFIYISLHMVTPIIEILFIKKCMLSNKDYLLLVYTFIDMIIF